MKKRLNILYDATILVDGEADTGSRSGIYFVALNLLMELKKRNDVDLTIFVPPCKSVVLKNRLNDFLSKTKTLYRSSFICDCIQCVLLFVRKLRMKFYKVNLIRKFFTLFEIMISSLYNLCAFRWQFLFSDCGYDIFFSPLTAAPWYIRIQKKIKKYVVIYDIIPFKIKEYAGQKKGSWFGHLLKHLNKKDCYFAISEATKNDFCSLFKNIDRNKIWVTHLAASEQFTPRKSNVELELIKRKYKIPEEKRYIFSLCTLEPRKNLIRAVREFLNFINKNNINDLIFVLGGGAWSDFEKAIKNSVKSLDLFEKYVYRAGYVADKDLPILYSNAEWFVYTSQYEGFGLPPLEAMQCGCPVITSNNSSLPEVVGDAGIMIDWDSDEQHVSAYEKYYFDEQIRKKNSAKGLARASFFSWSNTVDKMLRVMRQGDCT